MMKRKKRRSEAVPALVMIGPVTLWLIAFVAVPLLYVVFMTFCSLDNNYNLVFSFTLDNYRRLFNPDYVQIYGQSLIIAFATTVLCILIGYPFAFLIARTFTKGDAVYAGYHPLLDQLPDPYLRMEDVPGDQWMAQQCADRSGHCQ